MISSQARVIESETKPDLTPLLDIIFIVMVFLLLTANIHIQTMQINVPTTENSQVLNEQSSQAIAVNLLLGDKKWAINSQPYASWAEFSQQLLVLHRQYPKQSIVIGADKGSPVEQTLQLLAFLQKNKITAINIIMDEQQ